MFAIEGVCDGTRTTLEAFNTSGEAIAWFRQYVRSEDAGGWDLIEVYDLRGEEAERLARWERD